MREMDERIANIKSTLPKVAERYERATGRSFGGCGCRRNTIKLPAEYVYYTSVVDGEFLVNLTLPITKEQFDALGAGKELWEVLNA